MKGEITYHRDGTRTFAVDGRDVTEAEFLAAFPPKPIDFGGEPLAGHQTTAWPLVSDALAVHPDQVGKANERNRRHGVATRYQRDGRAVIPDRGDRKKLLRLEGLHDNNGGYGD